MDITQVATGGRTGHPKMRGPRGLGRTSLLLACLIGGVGACSHQRNNFAQELTQVQYPGWVLRGSGPAKVAESRYFFGVGQVAGMRNVALARSTADNRARAELTRAFELFVVNVLTNYARQAPERTGPADADAKGEGAAAQGGPGGTVSLLAQPAELSSEQLVKTLAATAVSQISVTEHWFHPDDGAVFSLTRLDLGQFVDNVARLHELRPSLRGWLQSHLVAQHDAMCEERLRRSTAAEEAADAP